MSNSNRSEYNFKHIIFKKLLKHPPNFIEKYYFLVELLNIDNKISQLSMWCYTDKPLCCLYICITITNNIWFWQNSTSTVHHLLS